MIFMAPVLVLSEPPNCQPAVQSSFCLVGSLFPQGNQDRAGKHLEIYVQKNAAYIVHPSDAACSAQLRDAVRAFAAIQVVSQESVSSFSVKGCCFFSACGR